MKTEEEFKELMRQWQKDPSWDLEDTEGFEEYRDRLLKVSKFWKWTWKEEARKKREIFEIQAEQMTNVELMDEIVRLKARVEELERKLCN